MNPYRELGVTPNASIEEIEARYRLLMREHHPDRHQEAGPDALAEAERRTRNLNWAMDRIRQDRQSESETPAWTWDRADRDGADDGPGPGAAGGRRGPWVGDNPFWRAPGDDDRRGDDTRTRDWFGNTIPGDEPVPCPFCRKPFDRLAEYEEHLRVVHRFKDRSSRPVAPHRESRLVRMVGALRFLPPWLVFLVAVGLLVMFGPYWFLGAIAFLGLVLWTQTTKIFRKR